MLLQNLQELLHRALSRLVNDAQDGEMLLQGLPQLFGDLGGAQADQHRSSLVLEPVGNADQFLFPLVLDSPSSIQDLKAELSPLGGVVDGIPLEEHWQGLKVALGGYPGNYNCRFAGVVVLGDHEEAGHQ